MDLLGVRPRGQSRHDVELSQQAAHNLVDVILRAKLFELGNDAAERSLHIGDHTLRVVLTLALEALPVFDELLSIEIRADRYGGTPDGRLSV